MAIISQEEVLKIARMSCIELEDGEIEEVTRELEQVLAYVARVQEVTGSPSQEQISSNNMRADVIVPTDPETVRAQAPDREGNFFVVPLILETTE
ncbi:MAG TPA: Asp-tRNA(Asn)/Glu-tRNA(Gln) amidotransferase subunit GatC [Candidatus Bathyarchaeia archaeon]|nr:Asp-tRNA(Asn)/Glu-tRNA(Gln) amidotransferase subunit GatC [Candidatus Bathyarchaeia archaeon]